MISHVAARLLDIGLGTFENDTFFWSTNATAIATFTIARPDPLRRAFAVLK
jgi:hypothetical protein